MMAALLQLADHDVRGLATALRSGRLVAPFTGLAVQRVVAPPLAAALAQALDTLVRQGFTAAQIATLLDLLLEDRAQRRGQEAVMDVVTTGPEAGATTNRDTSERVTSLERAVVVLARMRPRIAPRSNGLRRMLLVSVIAGIVMITVPRA